MCCIIARRSTVLLSLLSLQCWLSLVKSESIVIISLPQSDDTEVSASWERREEILPGAEQAIEEAKNDSLSFDVTLIEVTSGPVSRYEISYNALEVIINLILQKRDSDIIGIAGVFDFYLLAILNRFQVPIVSLVHSNKARQYSNVHYSLASISTLTDSILTFLKEIRPKITGLITELNQPYYMMVSDELRTKANTLLLDIQINKQGRSLSSIAYKILECNIHVILLSVGPSTAVAMLCEAYKSGLTWPNYAWILHSYRIEDLLQSSKSNEECDVESILEGVYVLQLTKERNESTSKTMHHSDRFNPYADLLYDSVWALISSTESIADLNESFHSNQDSSKVYIYHSLNSTASLTGIYDGTSRTLTKFNTIFIDYDLRTMTKGLLVYPYLLSLPILSFIFNTILLVLYIVFRNEPNIKSTSVSLSMLMFFGCYLLNAFVICDVLIDKYGLDLCMLRLSLSITGLPLSLLLATLLVKMLRVYHIFTTFKLPNPKSIKCKDYALVVYIVLILLPLVTLLILQSAIHPNHRVETSIERSGFIEIELSCYSKHSSIWNTLTLAYYYVVSIAVLIVAVKSRKVRYTRFKDTKKVNLLIFLLLIIDTWFSFYSYTFYIITPLGPLTNSNLFTYVGHAFTATLCQTLLFVPKIWPSIRERLCL